MNHSRLSRPMRIMMNRKIKAIVNIGITESVRSPLRDKGVGGLLIYWLLNMVTTVLPFCLLLFGALGNFRIGWYIHFAVFFECIMLLISNEKEITDYRSMAQFPISAAKVLFLRFIRRFLNPLSLLSTGLFIASIIITYRSMFSSPLRLLGIICITIGFLIIFEDVQLWKEKAGKGNLFNNILIVIAVILAVAPFFFGKQYSVVYLPYASMCNHWYFGFIPLAASIGAYVIILKIPQRFLDRFCHDTSEISTSNIIIKGINALPGNKPLKQLIMKDYRVMLHSNIGLLVNIALWVLISWLLTKFQDNSATPYLKNEFTALCYSGVVVQILATILSRPFAGDSYSAWVTLLSPVPRKYILISKDIVVLIACVVYFIPMSIFVAFTSHGIPFKTILMWFVLYMCYAFVMAIMLNHNIVTTKMKAIRNGKHKAFVNAAIEFLWRLLAYAAAVMIAVAFQALMDSKYSVIVWFICVPVLIILVFCWYMGLDGQVKYINKYTQSITQSLVLS